MHISFSRPFDGPGVSVDLHDFVPAVGYNRFLRRLCKDFGEKFRGWHQGPFMGIGRISYQGYHLRVFWNDYPVTFSFDCRDKAMAQELHARLVAYFAANPEVAASRVPPVRGARSRQPAARNGEQAT